MQLLACLRVPIHRDGNSAFLSARFGDGRANAFRAARHQHNFIFELQIHGERAQFLGSALSRGNN
jgi:hypothetical protein